MPRHIAVSLLVSVVSLFPPFTTFLLPNKFVINISMVLYFVVGRRMKFFLKSSGSMFLTNFNNSPVLKPCIKNPARQWTSLISWLYLFTNMLIIKLRGHEIERKGYIPLSIWSYCKETIKQLFDDLCMQHLVVVQDHGHRLNIFWKAQLRNRN